VSRLLTCSGGELLHRWWCGPTCADAQISRRCLNINPTWGDGLIFRTLKHIQPLLQTELQVLKAACYRTLKPTPHSCPEGSLPPTYQILRSRNGIDRKPMHVFPVGMFHPILPFPSPPAPGSNSRQCLPLASNSRLSQPRTRASPPRSLSPYPAEPKSQETTTGGPTCPRCLEHPGLPLRDLISCFVVAWVIGELYCAGVPTADATVPHVR
jgi:hypothetical protein